MSEKKQELVAYLTSTREQVTALVMSVDATLVDQPCKEGEWSFRETVAHLTATEPSLRARARKVIAGEDITPSPGFNADRAHIEEVLERRGQTMEQLLAQLNANRAETLCFIDVLTDADLAKSGHSPRHGEVTAEFFLRQIARHEITHIEEAIGALGQPITPTTS